MVIFYPSLALLVSVLPFNDYFKTSGKNQDTYIVKRKSTNFSDLMGT